MAEKDTHEIIKKLKELSVSGIKIIRVLLMHG